MHHNILQHTMDCLFLGKSNLSYFNAVGTKQEDVEMLCKDIPKRRAQIINTLKSKPEILYFFDKITKTMKQKSQKISRFEKDRALALIANFMCERVLCLPLRNVTSSIFHNLTFYRAFLKKVIFMWYAQKLLG